MSRFCSDGMKNRIMFVWYLFRNLVPLIIMFRFCQFPDLNDTFSESTDQAPSLRFQFDALLVVESDPTMPTTSSISCVRKHTKSAMLRWNLCGIDCWIAINRNCRIISNVLKTVDYFGFGTSDLLGPLKDRKGSDATESPIETV